MLLKTLDRVLHGKCTLRLWMEAISIKDDFFTHIFQKLPNRHSHWRWKCQVYILSEVNYLLHQEKHFQSLNAGNYEFQKFVIFQIQLRLTDTKLPISRELNCGYSYKANRKKKCLFFSNSYTNPATKIEKNSLIHSKDTYSYFSIQRAKDRKQKNNFCQLP